MASPTAFPAGFPGAEMACPARIPRSITAGNRASYPGYAP